MSEVRRQRTEGQRLEDEETEIRDQKSDIGGRKDRDQKSEVRRRRTEGQRSEIRSQMSEIRGRQKDRRLEKQKI